MNSKIKTHIIPAHLEKKIVIYQNYNIILHKNYSFYTIIMYKNINNNVFYVCESLTSKTLFKPFFDFKNAFDDFCKKFKEKTLTTWNEYIKNGIINSKSKYRILNLDIIIKHSDEKITNILNKLFTSSKQNLLLEDLIIEAENILKLIETEKDMEKKLELKKQFLNLIGIKGMNMNMNMNMDDINCLKNLISDCYSNNKIINLIINNENLNFHNKYNFNIVDINSIEYKLIHNYSQKSKITLLKIDKIGHTYGQYNKLYWHGTRESNVYSILHNGFLIPNSEGLMFGKGIYFADFFNKSLGYSDGYLFLCTLHCPNKDTIKFYASNKNNIEETYKENIVQGCGKTSIPILYENFNDLIIPKEYSNGITESSLNYNEYIVYNPSYIEIRYLVIINDE